MRLSMNYGSGICLNGALVVRQGLSSDQVELVKLSHVVRDSLFAEMEAAGSVARLREMATVWEQLEFVQQALWGFSLDTRMHGWNRVPGCSCPDCFNDPYARRHYNALDLPRVPAPNCLLHGDGWMPPGVPEGAEGLFWVVGGEYRTTEWDDMNPATVVVQGPFPDRKAATVAWRSLSMAHIDHCLWRVHIIGRPAV